MSVYKDLKIGTTIRDLRNKLGYPQKYIAEQLGMPVTTYSNYENNYREPKNDVLFRICQLLGTSTKDLVVISILKIAKGCIDESKL